MNTTELQSYCARENERTRRTRTFIGRCDVCDEPVYEEPGYCTLCAWDKAGRE